MTPGNKLLLFPPLQAMKLASDGEPDGISWLSSLTSFILVTRVENERTAVGQLGTDQFVRRRSRTKPKPTERAEGATVSDRTTKLKRNVRPFFIANYATWRELLLARCFR